MLPRERTTCEQKKLQVGRKKEKSQEFFIFHSRETDDHLFIYDAHLRFQTHTHTCFKRVNNNNAGVHNLFPVV